MKFLFNKSSTPESEDCLFLNIWRKNSVNKKLPVYVWIHGGYLHCGSNSVPVFDGTHFAEEDIIYVSINYRLGPLGCYDFSLFNPDRFDSNCTLSDQILALTWIKENIEAFGGDPNNITIAGQSSGASSVCALLASPKTKGLFQKVISQSAFTDGYSTRKDMKMLMDLYLKLLEVTPETIDTITTFDISRFKKATDQLFKEHQKIYPGSLMPGIMYDDDLFPKDCYDCIKNGYSTGIKLIIGTCDNEGSLFYFIGNFPNTWNGVKQYCDICQFSKDFSEVEKVYENIKTEKQKVIASNTDVLFKVSSTKVANYQSEVDDVWMYQLNYAPRLLRWIGLDVTHGAEIALTNKNTDKDYSWFMTPSGPKNQLTKEMFGSWVSFVKTGDPNGDHLSLTWEKYDITHRKVLYFDETSHIVDDPIKI